MWVASIAPAPLIGGCGGNDAPTDETSALRLCSAELRERLGISGEEHSSQTQMIGGRDDGWLVRGLSHEVPGVGERNYQCRLDDASSGPPTLTYLPRQGRTHGAAQKASSRDVVMTEAQCLPHSC